MAVLELFLLVFLMYRGRRTYMWIVLRHIAGASSRERVRFHHIRDFIQHLHLKMREYISHHLTDLVQGNGSCEGAAEGV